MLALSFPQHALNRLPHAVQKHQPTDVTATAINEDFGKEIKRFHERHDLNNGDRRNASTRCNDCNDNIRNYVEGTATRRDERFFAVDRLNNHIPFCRNKLMFE